MPHVLSDDFDRQVDIYRRELADLAHLQATATQASMILRHLCMIMPVPGGGRLTSLDMRSRHDRVHALMEDLASFSLVLSDVHGDVQREAERQLSVGRLSPAWRPKWSVEEAQSLFEGYDHALFGTPAEEIDRLIEAGRVLARESAILAVRVAQEAARNAQVRGSGAAGKPVIDGSDAGGRRHFLGGRPVHAGEPLYLLTEGGWIQGRFESAGRNGDAMFFLRPIPASSLSIALHVTERMLFAWPNEVE